MIAAFHHRLLTLTLAVAVCFGVAWTPAAPASVKSGSPEACCCDHSQPGSCPCAHDSGTSPCSDDAGGCPAAACLCALVAVPVAALADARIAVCPPDAIRAPFAALVAHPTGRADVPPTPPPISVS